MTITIQHMTHAKHSKYRKYIGLHTYINNPRGQVSNPIITFAFAFNTLDVCIHVSLSCWWLVCWHVYQCAPPRNHIISLITTGSNCDSV